MKVAQAKRTKVSPMIDDRRKALVEMASHEASHLRGGWLWTQRKQSKIGKV